MASLNWYKKLNDASGIKQRTESILLTRQVTCLARSFSRVIIHAPFTGYDILPQVTWEKASFALSLQD